MFGGVRNLDERIRGYMAQQAEGQLAARRQAVLDDLKSQIQSSPASAAKRVGERFGVSEGGLNDLERVLRGERGAVSQEVFAPNSGAMLQATADREAARNPLYNLQRMLSGESATDRAGQVAFYGAAAGGGAAGLTAAGQGLIALMGYLQQGQQSEEEREKPLA